MTTDEVVRALRSIPPPSEEYEEMLRQARRKHDLARAEHLRLGADLTGRIKRVFKRELGIRFRVESDSPGYLIDHGYATRRSPRRVRVEPYIKLVVHIPREGAPSVPGLHCETEFCSSKVSLEYQPRNDGDPIAWANRWAKWLASAPGVGELVKVPPRKPRTKHAGSAETSSPDTPCATEDDIGF